jgi:hypothetical protein
MQTLCMVCCAKLARGEISPHERRKAKKQIRLHRSGKAALLCNECLKENFEIDPVTRVATAKEEVELYTASDGGHDHVRKSRH